jgi:hypothetical protein
VTTRRLPGEEDSAAIARVLEKDAPRVAAHLRMIGTEVAR